jgi:hypothetical protein
VTVDRALPNALRLGAIALAALAPLAFWPGYLSRPPAVVDAYTHFHAAAGALWLALLIVQPGLVLRRRLALHRRIGRAAAAVALLFVVSSVLLAHHRFAAMDEATFGREAYTLYLPLSAVLLFGASVAMAAVHRGDVRLHARFVACTALVLVDPVVGRVLAFHVVELPAFWHYQLITFGLEGLVLCALAATLAPGSAPRRLFARFAAGYALVLLGWFGLAPTPAWQAVADAFRRLPLP